MPQLTLQSPIGELTVSEEDGVLVALDWGRGRDQAETPLLREAARQLQDYLDGSLATFDLPLAPAGTPFQRRAWAALGEIPAGERRSYGEVAQRLGSSARAIGQAVGRNPIPILIPCHRIVAADGAAGGYSGGEGVATKRWLLAHEHRAFARVRTASAQPPLPLGPASAGLQRTLSR